MYLLFIIFHSHSLFRLEFSTPTPRQKCNFGTLVARARSPETLQMAITLANVGRFGQNLVMLCKLIRRILLRHVCRNAPHLSQNAI